MHDESTPGLEPDQPPTIDPAVLERMRAKDLLGLPAYVDADTARLGWVYFVIAPEVDKIKIGSTTNHPRKRLGVLRQQCPLHLWPIGLLRGSCRVERHIQDMFRYIQWRFEWFETREMLSKFIIDQAAPWSIADEIDCTQELPIDEAAGRVKEVLAELDRWESRRADSIWRDGDNRKSRVSRRPKREGLPTTTTPKKVLDHYGALTDELKYLHNDPWIN